MRIERPLPTHDRPCVPANAHPVRRPDDRRRRPDGSAPPRKGWSRSGLPKGVYPAGKRFRAMVRHAGQLHHLGTFGAVGEAAGAVMAKLAELGRGDDA
jgi:hypothetical protein